MQWLDYLQITPSPRKVERGSGVLNDISRHMGQDLLCKCLEIRLRIAGRSLGGNLWDTFTVFSKYTCYMYVIQCYTFYHLIGAPKFEPNMSLLTQAVSSPDPTFSRRETSDVRSRISFVDSRVTNLVFNYMPCMNGLCAVIWYFTGKALANGTVNAAPHCLLSSPTMF